MTEREMRLEARVIALELVLTWLAKRQSIGFGLPAGEVDAAFAGLGKVALQATVPGGDPAKADMWTSEVSEAVERLRLLLGAVG